MKKSSFIMLVCLLAFVTLVGACTSFKISGVEISAQTSQGSVLGQFDTTVWVNKFLGMPAGSNLFNLTSGATDPKIVDAVKSEIAKLGGTKAINVKIEYQASFINLVIGGITGGIWAPASVHITGTVIK